MKIFNGLSLLIVGLALSGCAVLHHVQVGEIDSRAGKLVPFDIMVSETGVSLNDLRGAARLTKSKDAEKALQILALFQMGPRTGNPVYVKDYAKGVLGLIYEKCPSGNVTGLNSIRESRKYPVISGEIVKITGFCVMPKGS